MQISDLYNVLAVLYAKVNSKEICEEVSFPSFFQRMLSAFLLIFKANYLQKISKFYNG